MPSSRTLLLCLALLTGGVSAVPFAQAAGLDQLTQYELGIVLDQPRDHVTIRQRVTWVNPGPQPTSDLVFNLHAHHQASLEERLKLAKMLEIVRVPASEAVQHGRACEVQQVHLATQDGAEGPSLSFHFQEDNDTALVVELPQAVAPGDAVTVVLDLEMRLPIRQGRWGRWKGITCLTHFLPVLALRDGNGWRPVPFVAWYQPNNTESGSYRVRLRLPSRLKIACTCPVEASRNLEGDWRELDLGWCPARSFALLASEQYQEVSQQVGPVRVRCLALPEHAESAQHVLRMAATAVEAFAQEFGPCPTPELTVVEAHLGWSGQSCGGVVAIDSRFFALPSVAADVLESLVTRLVCQQWWSGAVGVDGFREPFLEMGVPNGLAHRLLDQQHGRNNKLVRYPSWLQWLPSVHREDLRMTLLATTAARGEGGAAMQEVPKFEHLANLTSIAGDRGGKIIGMIEARLGPDRFGSFLRHLYERYQFRILHVVDLQRELEEFTNESWDEFFRNWLYGSGMTDWCVESVQVHGKNEGASAASNFLAALHPKPAAGPCRATVIVRQAGDFAEPTVVGFAFGSSNEYRLRLPIVPGSGTLHVADPEATIEEVGDGRVRIEVSLPEPPTQVAVDPDQVLLDRNPSDNYWKPRVKYKLTPFYTFLDETDLTCAYDRWNVIAGPWYFDPNYNDPWFTRATLLGLRAGVYRTQQFNGGVYVGYRPDYRDIAAGVDATISHWPWAKAELGLNVERSLAEVREGGSHLNRAVLYARHVFDESDSLYLPPMHYVEGFAAHVNNFLPFPRPFGVNQPKSTIPFLGDPATGPTSDPPLHGPWLPPGAVRFTNLSQLGMHYHLDLMTPYWDPEMGMKLDVTTAAGFPVLGQMQQTYQASGQLSEVQKLPDGLGFLSQTRLALRGYGAVGLPSNGLLFSLGGDTLFRGFDLAQRQGNAVWIGSVEWRVPILRGLEHDCCDHLAGLRTVSLVPFYDVGNAYLNSKAMGPVAQAVGLGLRVDVAWVSFVERTTLRFDFAKTVNERSPVQFWFGIQHPF